MTVLTDIAVALRFFSRLPIPALPGEATAHGLPDFTRAAYAIPIAGAVLGAIGALALALGNAIGLSPLASALLALATMVLSTGAFHEDGLADTADGLGGGATRERKLEIMKDSRIGSYGTIAIVLSLGLRAVLIADILARLGVMPAVAVLIASGAISRAAAVWLGRTLPPARADGAAFAAGTPGEGATHAALAIAAALGFVLLWPRVGLLGFFLALAGPALAAYLMRRIAARQLGGQTGDIAGATQQLADIAVLMAVVIVARPFGVS
jgi:adenosylcobinamide-GDP ribazoletransferase